MSVAARSRRPLATHPGWAYAGTAGFSLGFGVQVPTFPAFVVGLPGGSPAVAGLLVAAFSAAAIAGRVPFLMGRVEGHARALLATGAVAAALATLLPLLSTGMVSLLTMRVASGLGDALFLTILFSSVIGGPDGSGQRRFAAVTAVMNVAFLIGPLAGEQIRLWAGYDLVWLTSAALLACGALAVPASEPHVPRSAARTRGRSSGSWGTIAAVYGPYLAFAVAPAALTTFGGIAMHRAGSSNAAAVFLALSLTTIAARVAVATGHLRPASPTWPFAIATVGALVVAGATGSAAGLVVGAAVLGVAQGLSLPACARLVVEHVPADRQRAAMAVSTIALDAGFILAGAAFGPVADAWGLSAVFAATAVACALATASSVAADRTLFDRIPLEENHVATR